MSDARKTALTEFAGDLQRLRRLAGSPSLNQLADLAAGLDPPLHRSTVSDKLAAKSLPDWDFVVSFVTACRRFAQRSGVPLHPDDVELARWDALHLRMLREIDRARDQDRLIRAATAELSRRTARVTPPGGDSGPSVVPRQLPAAPRTFTGRAAELAVLTALVDEAAGQAALVGGPAGQAAAVATIDGMAGVGKSALATYWGHRHAHRFPDGQLHLNLRGFDPGDAAITPPEALRGFLEALGVPPKRIPLTVDEQAAQFRSLLAGRRVLLVLDNARDAEQVRPLLPGTPGSAVLVTSRDRLTALAVTEAARPLTLDVIGADEARDLFSRRLGDGRAADEPAAVASIVDRCAGLPLALSIVAARAAVRPAWRLADLAEDLVRAGAGLEPFRADATPGGDIRAVFSWSYRQLNPLAANVFRTFGRHPSADLGLAAVASIAAVSTDRARAVLAELFHAHLVEEPRPGRFGCHDLLRAYAAELCRQDDAQTALLRMFDHYLHGAYAADRMLEPGRDPITLDDPVDGIVIEPPRDAGEASAWFADNHPALAAAVDLAAGTGFDRHAWQLAWTLTPYLDRRADWHTWASTHLTALAAAERLGDLPAVAYARRILGRAHIHLGRLDDAWSHFESALRTYAELGDGRSTANTHEGMSLVCELQGRFAEALEHSEEALNLLQAGGHHDVVGRLLNSVGWCRGLIGDHEAAIDYCRRGLAHNQALGDRNGEAESWDTLGDLHNNLGRHAEAVGCLRHALELTRELGYRFREGATLDRLGDAFHGLHDAEAAREHWRLALVLLDEARDPHAGDLRAKLGGGVPD